MAETQRPHVTTLRLSDDEREALDALVEHEERTGGDILRRALRAYAQEAGVWRATVKRTPRKKAG